MKKREEIAEKYKWDLSDYALLPQDCEEKLEKFKSYLPEVQAFKGRLTHAETIFQCLTLESKISQEISKLEAYAYCRKSEDTVNHEITELEDKINAFCAEFSTAISYIDVEIGTQNNDFLLSLQHDKRHPEFSNYFKAILRNKKYILSEKEEEIMSQIGTFAGGFESNMRSFDSADITFKPAYDSNGKEYEVSIANYEKYMSSPDAVLRESMYKNLNGGYKNLENTLANNYSSFVKMVSTLTKIRGYDSVLQSQLYADELTEDFYNLLIKKVKEHAVIFRRYSKLKQKILGLETLKICDLGTQIGKTENSEISFEEAFNMVVTTLQPLGEDYISILKKSVSERWIDVFDNENKYSGQYECACYGCHPLVFLKFNNDISSTLTLAHELGHAMHSYYSNKSQPYEKHDYPLFLAEIASTVNETFMCMHLIKNAKTKDEKIYYINEFLDNARATILTQTQFAEFEKLVFEKYDAEKSLSKNFFLDTYERLTKEYNGEDVELLPETKNIYSRIIHFYWLFYVYKYATGMLSAILIVKKFMDNEQGIQEKYIKFLSSGSSLSPLETLKIVGVDLENPKTFDEAFEFLDKVVKDFENTIK
ncbi:MAG: oligoendopeptidase F [Clostridia bacterium]|nr:oligoendopeptidase F [Clostridia bacterium]